MAIAEISIVPLGTGSPSVSGYVAACLKVLRASGLPYEIHGMGTIVEGDLSALLGVIREMHEIPFEAGVQRVVTTIRIDDRRDKESAAQDKVISVIEKM
jgi:uncharacterized protein (TIGR00106 family)